MLSAHSSLASAFDETGSWQLRFPARTRPRGAPRTGHDQAGKCACLQRRAARKCAQARLSMCDMTFRSCQFGSLLAFCHLWSTFCAKHACYFAVTLDILYIQAAQCMSTQVKATSCSPLLHCRSAEFDRWTRLPATAPSTLVMGPCQSKREHTQSQAKYVILNVPLFLFHALRQPVCDSARVCEADRLTDAGAM